MRAVAAVVAMTVAIAIAIAPSTARGDTDGQNWLIGPLFGIRLGGPSNVSRLTYGIEGGWGLGPERINVGYTRRLDKGFTYIELDPWYVVGATLGVGVDSDGEAHPVLGVWEGFPIVGLDGPCSDWHDIVTLAGGYRYTGVHELYVTIKAGTMDGSICFD